jgi:predicted RNase H-like HicB family nuclease
MEQPKYHIDIFWSDEDGGYIANVPALRYCSAFGETYEEALHEVLVAMELHLDTLRELDRPVPESGGRTLSKKFFENWVEVLEGHAELNRRTLSNLTELVEAQKRVLLESPQDATDAYMDFINSMIEEHRSEREQPQRRATN